MGTRIVRLVVIVAAVFAAGAACAKPPPKFPALPPKAKATQSRLLAHVQPTVKGWIVQEGARLAAGQGDSAIDIGLRFPYASAAQRNALTFLSVMQARDDLKSQIDSMSELGETESLRLQMAMDRVSKFMTALSNIEKKADDTDSSMIQNFK